MTTAFFGGTLFTAAAPATDLQVDFFSLEKHRERAYSGSAFWMHSPANGVLRFECESGVKWAEVWKLDGVAPGVL
jgi:hypothetical protein